MTNVMLKRERCILLSAIIFLFIAVGTMFIMPAKAGAATIKCYTIGTGNTVVYSNTGLSKKYGTIYATDEISVLSVTDKYCKVTYPVKGGTKTGYIPTNAILTKTVGNTVKASAKIITYRRNNTAYSYGYIAKGDSVKVLGRQGSYTQVKYPVSGGYKYAFVTNSNADAYLGTGSSGYAPETYNGTKAEIEALVFDAKYYADTYADLKAAYGYDETKLSNHWKKYGISEGRAASPVLDLKYYLANNTDLQNAFGKTNYTRAYQHFLEYGYGEYRASSKYYYGDYYRKKYEDLKSYDSKFLLKHYLQYGISEGRYANTVKYTGSAATSANNVNTNVSSYSVTNNVLTVNGVALTEYKIGSKCSNTYYSNVNGKSTYVGGSQCLGYARYVQRKLYGYDEFNNGGKFTDISGVISYKNVTADKIKSLVNLAGVGGHIRTNNNNSTNRHSLVIIGISSDGFTITDGNSDGKLTVRYKTFTWQGYVNTYGKRGIQFIKKYSG